MAEFAMDRPSLDVIADRQARQDRDIHALDQEKADKAAVERIAEDVSSLRKLIIGFFSAFALAAIGFGFTMIELMASAPHH